MKLSTMLLALLISANTFAQGYYFEMKMSSSQQGDLGTMKAYSQDGNSRSEMNMSTPMGAMTVTSLILKSTPDKVYMVSDKDKTYSEIDVSKSEDWKDAKEDDYEVTVLGKETVNGYKSTHVMVKHKSTKTEEEMWTTTDLPDYNSFMTAKTKFTGRDNLNKALAAKGAAGFAVRIKVTEHGNEIQMDFVKAEKRSNPASMFSLEGYKKSEGAAGMFGGNREEMMQKIQNMSPEERQKMMEQMQKQYQRPH